MSSTDSSNRGAAAQEATQATDAATDAATNSPAAGTTTPTPSADIVEVAAAVILRTNSAGAREFLLAQRPPGKVYAGYWEFPGGKVEPGETMRQALDRELVEELGIEVTQATPWLTREFVYPHATVRIRFFRVEAWRGGIAPIEHSGFAWLTPGAPSPVEPILPANGPILRALELPARLLITNAAENSVDGELARLARALGDRSAATASAHEGRACLVQVRDKELPAAERQRLAAGVVALARQHSGVRVLINDDAALARSVGADGAHLPAARLLAKDAVRPDFPLVGASCHSAAELARAAELGCDFAVLGPVLPTPTHSEAAGCGWEAFAQLAARSPLPIYALGGMREEMLATACAHGAQGIALMRGWG
ncbi:Nudix family hydrolase [Rhodocyclus tenuis]|uniref:8-oxo-dGTP diphosphatase n=1 Tax=Rhodocyclus tenuis TaxID=1066 RepID=A0A840G1A6_RHOTE|nr:Nudix family hydrolase [Rhodocyclus tenuis]MBB4246233.1 8-oxo-dGTP diphosphatase [Rhodocyclus tenuis]